MLKLLAITAAIMTAVFAWFLLQGPNNNGESSSTQLDSPNEMSQLEDTADLENRPSLIIGDTEAPITLVEYGDFKCPSCNEFHQGVGKQLRDQYVDSGQLKIEFRNFPFIGPDSGRAARASYCANDLGLFSEYHDKVYDFLWKSYYTQGDLNAEFRDVLTSDQISRIMGDSIEDGKSFEACINSDDYNRFIDADLLLGAEDGITGTPGFVIAEQTITGPSNYNTFKTLIEIELSR